jgi:uncharacterized protein with GYD domain
MSRASDTVCHVGLDWALVDLILMPGLGCRTKEKKLMPTYISLGRWTPQGAHTMKESPARLEAAKKAFAADGVKMLHFFLTMGTHDMVIITEAPNDEVMAKAILSTIAKGGITTQTVRAFTEDEYKGLMKGLQL